MKQNDKLKVAWLSPFPISYLKDKIKLQKFQEESHPATWIINLAQALVKFTEIDLHIITLTQNISFNQKIKLENITYHFIKRSRYFISLITLFQIDKFHIHRVLDSICPQLVHCHGTEDIYSLAGVTSNFPCIISLQGIITELLRNRKNRYDLKTFIYYIVKFIEQYTVKRGKFFIAKTPFAAEFIKYLSPRAKIFHIENPISDLFFRVKRNVHNDFQLLFVGYVIPEKGIEELINAIAILKDDFPSITLRIVGPSHSTYVQKRLKNHIESLGIDKQIKFCGFKSSKNVAKELSSAEIIIVPSHMDTSPNVISEAMAAGTPVLASCVGGIPDMIQNGKTGTLVKPFSSEQLAKKIAYLVRNRNEREQMADDAKKIALKRHEPKIVAFKMKKAYEDILMLSSYKK